MRPGPSVFPRPSCTHADVSSCPRAINFGRTYRFYNETPIVPFGYGLSYTNFSYAIASRPVAPVSMQYVVHALAVAQRAGRALPTSREPEPHLSDEETRFTYDQPCASL